MRGAYLCSCLSSHTAVLIVSYNTTLTENSNVREEVWARYSLNFILRKLKIVDEGKFHQTPPISPYALILSILYAQMERKGERERDSEGEEGREGGCFSECVTTRFRWSPPQCSYIVKSYFLSGSWMGVAPLEFSPLSDLLHLINVA